MGQRPFGDARVAVRGGDGPMAKRTTRTHFNLHFRVRPLLLRFVVNALSLVLTVLIVPHVFFSGDYRILSWLIISAVFGLLTTFLKPLVQLVLLPLIFVSYGLVIVLINTVMLGSSRSSSRSASTWSTSSGRSSPGSSAACSRPAREPASASRRRSSRAARRRSRRRWPRPSRARREGTAGRGRPRQEEAQASPRTSPQTTRPDAERPGEERS